MPCKFVNNQELSPSLKILQVHNSYSIKSTHLQHKLGSHLRGTATSLTLNTNLATIELYLLSQSWVGFEQWLYCIDKATCYMINHESAPEELDGPS